MESISSLWLQDPLKIINQRFPTLTQNAVCDSQTLSALFSDLPSFESVPYLESLILSNESKQRNGSLVKFRGLVQDMLNPEIYVFRNSKCETGILKEAIEGPTDFNDPSCDLPMIDEDGKSFRPQDLGERLPAYIVSIPGQTDWLRSKMYKNKANPASSHRASHMIASVKRSFEDCDLSMDLAGANQEKPQIPSRSLSIKRQTCTSVAGNLDAERSIGLNLPFPQDASKGSTACLVKFYDSCFYNNLRLLDAVEVVAVLEYVSPISNRLNEEEMKKLHEFGLMNDIEKEEIPAFIPRLHVIKAKKLEEYQLNPLVDDTTISFTEAMQELRQVLPSLHSTMIQYLSQPLGRDRLAAEYLLMNIVSKIYSRSSEFTAGKMVLNLVLPENTSLKSSEICSAIKSLVPHCASIPLSIQTLNSFDLFPIKDYESNRLVAGPLQLVKGSSLFIDETEMDEGGLSERGYRNIQALKALCDRQVVFHDFKYHQTEVPTDIKIVIVSKGSKSLLPCDFAVHVKENMEPINQIQTSEDLLHKFRLALTLLTHKQRPEFDIPQNMANTIEQDFVQARKSSPVQNSKIESNSNIDQSCLAKWLTISRLAAVGFAEDDLCENRWRYAMHLEHQRKARLANESKQSNIVKP